MSWEVLDLVSVALLSCELESPATIQLRDQVLALRVVDAVLFPALCELALELSGL